MNRFTNARPLSTMKGARNAFAVSLLAASAAMAQTAPTIPFLSTVAATAHPRTAKPVPLPAATLQLLTTQVNNNIQGALPVEPNSVALASSNSSVAAQASSNVAAVAGNESDRMIAAAYHWLQTGSAASKADARRRALNLASWTTRGATGVWYQDQAARSIVWGLALTYDWLYPTWTAGERQAIVAAIRVRVQDMLGKKMPGYPTGWAPMEGCSKMDCSPYDSHAVTTVGMLAVACSALVGEDPMFARCYSQTVPRYTKRPIPWGGDDGGFANGTAYSAWGLYGFHFVVWDMLKTTLGVDLWQTSWAKNHINYLAYFLPPGSPNNTFGDAAEQQLGTQWAGQAKVYAPHYANPLADWYAKNLSGENPLQLPLLISPRKDWSSVPAPFPAGLPSSIQIPSIGWVAMHSDLANTARTSVYFKSSQFGSYNHSHADQNSFVVNARGSALAIDSGYYDYYGSAHWTDWYKQTRAHNAITFDGGQGQTHDSLAAKGRITSFENAAGYTTSTGDATTAYGGALTSAIRSMVYVRPDLVLVVDGLASATARTWEWNIHAANQMVLSGGQELEIQNNGVKMCVQMLEAPAGAFAQTDVFTTAPTGNYAAQWHARYSTAAKSTQTRFIALLDIECKHPVVSLQNLGGKTVANLGAIQIEISADGRQIVKR